MHSPYNCLKAGICPCNFRKIGYLIYSRAKLGMKDLFGILFLVIPVALSDRVNQGKILIYG